MKNVTRCTLLLVNKITWLLRAANQEVLQLTCFSYVSLMIGFNLVFILLCFLTYFVSYRKMTLMPKLSFSSRGNYRHMSNLKLEYVSVCRYFFAVCWCKIKKKKDFWRPVYYVYYILLQHVSLAFKCLLGIAPIFEKYLQIFQAYGTLSHRIFGEMKILLTTPMKHFLKPSVVDGKLTKELI